MSTQSNDSSSPETTEQPKTFHDKFVTFLNSTLMRVILLVLDGVFGILFISFIGVITTLLVFSGYSKQRPFIVVLLCLFTGFDIHVL